MKETIVDKYMLPVETALRRKLEWPSPEFTEIYNLAYEAVSKGISDTRLQSDKLIDTIAEAKALLSKLFSKEKSSRISEDKASLEILCEISDLLSEIYAEAELKQWHSK